MIVMAHHGSEVTSPSPTNSAYIRQHLSKSARIGRSHFHTHKRLAQSVQIAASPCRDLHNFSEQLTVQSVLPPAEAQL